MPGEMTMNGEFNVTRLEAWEIETPGQPPIQSNIIDWTEPFFLRAYFEGSGPGWINMRQNGFEYRAQFYAEGMGPGVADQDFGTVTGNLVPGQDAYEVDSNEQTIGANAIFRCGVMVTFRPPGGGPWFGVLGYNEDCVIQIHTLEEIG